MLFITPDFDIFGRDEMATVVDLEGDVTFPRVQVEPNGLVIEGYGWTLLAERGPNIVAPDAIWLNCSSCVTLLSHSSLERCFHPPCVFVPTALSILLLMVGDHVPFNCPFSMSIQGTRQWLQDMYGFFVVFFPSWGDRKRFKVAVAVVCLVVASSTDGSGVVVTPTIGFTFLVSIAELVIGVRSANAWLSLRARSLSCTRSSCSLLSRPDERTLTVRL